MMNRPVIVTTPIPTLEEFGKSLGLSKARQKALMQIVMGADSGVRQPASIFESRRNVSRGKGRSRVAAKKQ